MSKKLGTMIKNARTEKGLTQAELAKKTGGITAADVSAIERGTMEPTQAVLKKMAKPLGLTQKSLLDAAAGRSTSAKKTSSAKKTDAKSSSKKTSSSGKKTSSSGKKTSSSKSSSETLTAEEKKLLKLYRKADADMKKSVIKMLEGKNGIADILGSLLGGKDGLGSLLGGGKTDGLMSLLGGKANGASSGGKTDGVGGILGNLLRSEGGAAGDGAAPADEGDGLKLLDE